MLASAGSVSLSSFPSAAYTAPSICTSVDSDCTLKDTMISWSWIFSLAIVKAKSAEFLTVKFEFPERGDNMLAKKANKSYAKVLTHDTIGLSGVSAL